MKPRTEVVRFIEAGISQIAIPDKHLRNRHLSVPEGEKEPHHFGLVELRHLMDFLYDGPPLTKDECLSSLHKR